MNNISKSFELHWSRHTCLKIRLFFPIEIKNQETWKGGYSDTLWNTYLCNFGGYHQLCYNFFYLCVQHGPSLLGKSNIVGMLMFENIQHDCEDNNLFVQTIKHQDRLLILHRIWWWNYTSGDVRFWRTLSHFLTIIAPRTSLTRSSNIWKVMIQALTPYSDDVLVNRPIVSPTSHCKCCASGLVSEYPCRLNYNQQWRRFCYLLTKQYNLTHIFLPHL